MSNIVIKNVIPSPFLFEEIINVYRNKFNFTFQTSKDSLYCENYKNLVDLIDKFYFSSV